MKKPLVTVIIPTYNRAQLLRRSINSVLEQTYKNLELIIVDDASTDGTEEMVKSVNDSRIKCLKNISNKGVAYSRNRGIKEARGEFIAFLDDDDEWLPQKLHKQMALFESLSDEYGLVYCGLYYCNKYGDILQKKPAVYRGDVFKHALEGTIAGGCVPVIRKSVFSEVGLHDEYLHNAVDWDINIRIAHKYKFDFVEHAMVKYYIYGKQLSMKPYKKLKSTIIIYEKYKKFFIENGLHIEIMKKLARLYIILDKKKECYNCLKQAWYYKKYNLNVLVQLLLSITLPCTYKKIKFRRSFTHFGNITLY